MRRPVNRELDPRNSADTEHDLLPARLMDGTVAKQPGVRLQQVGIPFEQRAEMSRSGLLFAFEEEFEVNRRLDSRRSQGVERGQHSNDWRLVVARRAGIETP